MNKSRNKLNQPPTGEGKKQSPRSGDANKLVLQAVLPPLIQASGSSVLRFEGGTHNDHAPPYDFLERTFLPLVSRIGSEHSDQTWPIRFLSTAGSSFHVFIPFLLSP